MSMSAARNAKLMGDTFHLLSYPFLFWSLRHERRIGVSLNSQVRGREVGRERERGREGRGEGEE